MHVILWRFRARPGREAEFEQAYGEDGTWERFFRRGEGFLGTELLRATDGTYLTIDRWVSETAFRAFRESDAQRYAELDAACKALTLDETPIGELDA